MDTYSLYAGQFLPFNECFAPKGHDACAGCGLALAVRHVCKALEGKKVDLDKAVWQIPMERNNPVSSGNSPETAGCSMLSIKKQTNNTDAVLDICFDNEAQEKTDVAVITKKLPSVAAASGYLYSATACPSHPFDLIEKVRKAWAANGSSFLHILCPCPVAWGYEPENSVKLARMAVETRIFPLYEIVDGYYTVTVDQPHARPVRDYLARQTRFSSVRGKKAEQLQSAVDTAFDALKDKARRTAC